MSLLSDTRGTPYTVWALVNLLNSNKGELELEALSGWMSPFTTGLDEHGKLITGSVLDQTVGAAASLDLVESDRTNTVRLSVSSPPSTLSTFSDWVHERLISLPLDHADSVVLEAYAWLVATCAKNKGTTWIRLKSREQLAGAIRDALTTEQTGSNKDFRFNVTKLPRWRDWLEFIGLGLEIPTNERATTTYYPCVTERMERELNKLRLQFGTDKEIEGSEILSAIAECMPYIDGGLHFNLAAKRIEWKPNPRHLSIVVSTALRDLHDDGFLELKMYGDTRNAYTLTVDPTHRFDSFKTITLKATEAVDE